MITVQKARVQHNKIHWPDLVVFFQAFQLEMDEAYLPCSTTIHEKKKEDTYNKQNVSALSLVVDYRAKALTN